MGVSPPTFKGVFMITRNELRHLAVAVAFVRFTVKDKQCCDIITARIMAVCRTNPRFNIGIFNAFVDKVTDNPEKFVRLIGSFDALEKELVSQ